MQPLQPFAMRHANEIQVSSESHDSSASQGMVVIRGEEVGTFPRNSKSDDPQYKYHVHVVVQATVTLHVVSKLII